MYNQIARNKQISWLLIIAFTVIVIAIGWFVGEYMNAGFGPLTIAIVIAIVMSIGGYFHGDKLALATSGAKAVTKSENPYLVRMVENLAITAGLPTPKTYIIDDPAINAFATGRNPEHASIAVTTGAIKRLENEELEGVIAHEMSHVKNYDIRLMTIVLVLVGIITLMADWFLRIQFWSGGNRSSSNRSNGSVLMVIGLILIILSPIFAEIMKLAVSRKREFLADASGALLTRYPEGLARALEKIGQDHHQLSRASNATAHLFFSNPFRGKKMFAKLFSTHPPIEERVKALRAM